MARAASLLAEFKTVMSWGGEGKSGGKQFVDSPGDVINECTYQLRKRGALGGERIVRRVRGNFSRRRGSDLPYYQ